jgi:2-C-methyl-D-erythritol 4-phosphate cytidylyltransferase
MSVMKHSAIIVGGGLGKRFKGEIPKQFLLLDKRPIIVHTAEAFQRSPAIDAMVVVVPAGWEERCKEELNPYAFDKIKAVIEGGETRQLSCYQALRFLKPDPPRICIVHDAVRPLVSQALIAAAVQAGREGMTLGLRAAETIVEAHNGEIIKVLPRDHLYQIQTPQAFPFQTLWDAHRQALEVGITDASDDAGLVLRAGYRVTVLEGDPRNIKITGPVDLDLAQLLLRAR